MVLLVLGLLAAACPGAAGAGQAPDTPARPRLVVGTTVLEPFAFRNPGGAWTGLTVELWDQMARHLGVDYEIREMSLDELVQAVGQGKVDLAATALTVTAEREKVLDFSLPYLVTGLGLAVPARAHGTWWANVERVLSSRIMEIIMLVLASLLAAALVIWVVERHKNREQFGGGSSWWRPPPPRWPRRCYWGWAASRWAPARPPRRPSRSNTSRRPSA